MFKTDFQLTKHLVCPRRYVEHYGRFRVLRVLGLKFPVLEISDSMKRILWMSWFSCPCVPGWPERLAVDYLFVYQKLQLPWSLSRLVIVQWTMLISLGLWRVAVWIEPPSSFDLRQTSAIGISSGHMYHMFILLSISPLPGIKYGRELLFSWGLWSTFLYNHLNHTRSVKSVETLECLFYLPTVRWQI